MNLTSILRCSLAAITLFTLSACSLVGERILPTTEYVLTDGMVISAQTKNGNVTITGKKGTKRVFSGEGWKKTRALWPRDYRWYGSLGMYDAAWSLSPYGRLLVNEGRLFFKSKSDALKFLRGRYTYPAYNNQGLAVGFTISPIPGGEPARTVEIWQIYVNGKRPRSLRGANDKTVTVDGGAILDTATPFPAVIGAELTLD